MLRIAANTNRNFDGLGTNNEAAIQTKQSAFKSWVCKQEHCLFS